MKYLALCLVFSMLFSLSLQACDVTVNGPSADTCLAINLDASEKDPENDDLGLVSDTCCYVKAGNDEGCAPFKKANISDYIKYVIKTEGSSVKVTINCGGTTVSSDDLKSSDDSDSDSESSDDSGKFLSLASGLLFLLLLA